MDREFVRVMRGVERSTPWLAIDDVADAMQVAVEMLDHDDLDDQSTMLPREPLAADAVPPGVPFTNPRRKRSEDPGIKV